MRICLNFSRMNNKTENLEGFAFLYLFYMQEKQGMEFINFRIFE